MQSSLCPECEALRNVPSGGKACPFLQRSPPLECHRRRISFRTFFGSGNLVLGLFPISRMGKTKTRVLTFLKSHLHLTTDADLHAGLLLSNSQASSDHPGFLLVTPSTSALRLLLKLRETRLSPQRGTSSGGCAGSPQVRWQALLSLLSQPLPW